MFSFFYFLILFSYYYCVILVLSSSPSSSSSSSSSVAAAAGRICGRASIYSYSRQPLNALHQSIVAISADKSTMMIGERKIPLCFISSILRPSYITLSKSFFNKSLPLVKYKNNDETNTANDEFYTREKFARTTKTKIANNNNINKMNNHQIQINKEPSEPSIQTLSQQNNPISSSLSSSSSLLPFDLIVNHDDAKLALLLASTMASATTYRTTDQNTTTNTCNSCSSVLLIGRKGTCKSVLAHAIQELLPPIQIDGNSNDTRDAMSSTMLPPPFVKVPINCQEDGLLGTLDLEQSISKGEAIFEPGLLSKAHNGILVLDDLQLMSSSSESGDDDRLHIIFNAIEKGYVTIEREGISLKYPCVPQLVIGCWNPYEDNTIDIDDDNGKLLLLNNNNHRPHWMDHFAMQVSLDSITGKSDDDVINRVKVVQNVEGYQDKTRTIKDDYNNNNNNHDIKQTKWTNKIRSSRILLSQVNITEKQIKYLCDLSTEGNCEGQRGELFAAKLAKASAAFDGRTKVLTKDLQRSIMLCIIPRCKRPIQFKTEPPPPPPSASVEEEEAEEVIEQQQQELQEQQSTSSSPSPPQPTQQEERNIPEEQQIEMQQEEEEKKDKIQEEEEEEEEILITIPYEQFWFGIDSTELDTKHLLEFQKNFFIKSKSKRGRGRKGGDGSKLFNLRRGRFVKAIFPKGGATKDVWKQGKIAIGATLRAAAPYQKLRHSNAIMKTFQLSRHQHDKEMKTMISTKEQTQDSSISNPKEVVKQIKMILLDEETKTIKKKKVPKVILRDSDIRIQQLKRKAGTLVIFVVDASGSMALNRMGAAKGAAISLLEESYRNRDFICLIEFHDLRSSILVPPTKSITLLKRRLTEIPCGGKSPLGHALKVAIRTGLNSIKVKQNVGNVVIVLFTDGRANVPTSISEDVIQLTKQQQQQQHLIKTDGTTEASSISNASTITDFRTISASNELRIKMKEEVLELGKQLGLLKNFDFLIIDSEDKFVGTGMAKELADISNGHYYHMTFKDERHSQFSNPVATAVTRQVLENAKLSNQ